MMARSTPAISKCPLGMVPWVEDHWTRQGRLLCITQKEFRCYHEAMRIAEGFISREETRSDFLGSSEEERLEGNQIRHKENI